MFCGTFGCSSVTTHRLVVIAKFTDSVLCVNGEGRRHTKTHIALRTLVSGASSLAADWANPAAVFATFFWPILVITAVQSHNICCNRTWPSNQTGGGAILASSSFFDQIPHQKKSEILVGTFSPTRRYRIQLLSTVRSRRWKNNLMVHLKLRRHIE